ncbi:TauD/TfdA dioxygenase family protein [Nocardia sp. NPDC059236]|uniref:TauD/TfdA dioxygenase family protein n=1 Tax=Nocardia sp. NPDC059236 TaxID=3346783 RepID=UPI00367878E0
MTETFVATERDRLAMLQWQHFDAVRMGSTLGAEISGVDLTTDLPEVVVAELRQALLDYKVLSFREQPMSAAQHVVFARRFGELEIHPFVPSNTGHPDLIRFRKSGQVTGFENGWHHELTWRERPSLGVIQHALEVPVLGGDTLFSDMYAAYELLDEETRSLIDSRDAIHDFSRVFGNALPEDKREVMRDAHPTVKHPMVCVHPETGRRHLFVNQIFVEQIDGMDRDAGAELLDRVCHRIADHPEHQVRLRWEPHTVAFWDNRAVQHYTMPDYWPTIRVMDRASIVGTRPHR